METLNKHNDDPDIIDIPPKLTLNYSDMYPNDKDDVNYMYTDAGCNSDDFDGRKLYIFTEKTGWIPYSSLQQNYQKTSKTELS